MKIYLIRHGESTGDIEGRYGGTYDDELTESGKKQAHELAGKLKGRNIEIVYHSPYKRAKETALILAKSIGVKSEEVNDIRERNSYGVLSGLTKAEARTKHPKEFQEIENREYQTTVTGAEAYPAFKERIISVFKRIINQNNYSTMAIVTHGGPIYCLFRELIANREIKNVGDCALLELDYENDKVVIENLGKAHIE